MAATAAWYGLGLEKLGQGDVDYKNDTIRVALMDSSFAFNQDTDEFWSDVNSTEVASGAGYTSGGQALASKDVAYDAGSNEVRYPAADTVWSPGAGETLTANYCVVYKDTGTASSSPLLGQVNLAGDGSGLSASGADFTIDWNDAGGVFTLQAQ